MKCRKCKQEGPQTRKNSNICRECWTAYMRNYNEKNRLRIRAMKREYHYKNRGNPDWVMSERKRGREYWQALRHEVLLAYGGAKCACCGEKEDKFLSIDHINNDGAQHRRRIGGSGGRTWIWLRENNYPDGFQVLCMNCNMGKAKNGGICPHKTHLANKLCELGETLEQAIPSQALAKGKV